MNRKRVIIFIIVFIIIVSIPTLITVVHCAFGCVATPEEMNPPKAENFCLVQMQSSCQVTGEIPSTWQEEYIRNADGIATTCREVLKCNSNSLMLGEKAANNTAGSIGNKTYGGMPRKLE